LTDRQYLHNLHDPQATPAPNWRNLPVPAQILVQVWHFSALRFLLIAVVSLVGAFYRTAPQAVLAKDVGLMSGSPRTFLVHCGALIFVAVFTFAGRTCSTS